MVPDQQHAKLDPKVEEHIFTSVAETAKAWRYYNTVSKWVQLSCNITFDLNYILSQMGKMMTSLKGWTRQASHSQQQLQNQ